jgi:excisionase family DNA binding protein
MTSKAMTETAARRFLTVPQVAAMFHVSHQTIRAWAHDSRIQPIRLGHQMLFDEQKLMASAENAAK